MAPDRGGPVKANDVYINAIGVHLPEVYSAERAVAEGLYDEADYIANELTGVTVADDTPPFEMAVRAARQAFDRGDINPCDVDLILYASSFHQGPDGWCPASYVQRNAVGGDAPAIDIRHGCNGLFSSLHLAVGHLNAAAEHRAVLFAAGDNCNTPLIDRWRTLSPGMLVGDGASAVVVSKTPGFAKLLCVDSVAIPELEDMHRSGEPLFNPVANAGKPVDFKSRAAHFIRNSPVVNEMRNMLQKAQQTLNDRTLAHAGIEMSDIKWLSHSHTSRSMLEERLLPMFGLPLSRTSWDLVRDVGHVGVSDQVVAFERLLNTGRLVPGDHYLMAGLGPGINITTAVIQIVDSPPWLPGA
jgi:3-oxoacyl-[acyl-carrier-protein] synthase-3